MGDSHVNPPRPKEERRRRAWSYQGNALVFEMVLGSVSLGHLRHPNRLMETFRSSNKGRRVA
jgi:hypothetical protein